MCVEIFCLNFFVVTRTLLVEGRVKDMPLRSILLHVEWMGQCPPIDKPPLPRTMIMFKVANNPEM